MATVVPHILRIGTTQIALYDGYTVTQFADGLEVHARHDDVQHLGQAATAQDLGYPDVRQMNREHDVYHALLASWLGLDASPVLRALADGCASQAAAWREEAAVLAVQRFAVSQGVDVMALAAHLGDM
jgi:hypothetical protein